MSCRRGILVALCLGALAAPWSSFAQNFPAKPLRLIVRAPPGGTDDLIARLVAPAISRTLGQQVIVDYRHNCVRNRPLRHVILPGISLE